jgi:hypothetical protein
VLSERWAGRVHPKDGHQQHVEDLQTGDIECGVMVDYHVVRRDNADDHCQAYVVTHDVRAHSVVVSIEGRHDPHGTVVPAWAMSMRWWRPWLH